MQLQRNFSQPSTDHPVRIEIRMMFLQIGTIDTQTQQFDARIAIEARWIADDLILSTLDDNSRHDLSHGQIIHLSDDFKEQNWHPQLFLLNKSIKNYEEKIQHSLKKDDPLSVTYIREQRLIKASFCTIFHLHHYPSDVQTLNISIGSSLNDDKVELVAHPTIASGINTEVFEAQQEWYLYEHVESKSRKIRNYFSLTNEKGDLDKPGYEKERSVLTFSCHVARRTKYFIWNGYCIIFLLTGVAFSSFAITANQTQQRLNVAYTLLLSQIAFRWTISVSHLLPAVSYLTTMDKYSVMSMCVLILLGIWHAIIGSLIFTFHDSQPITPETYWLWVDRYVFFVLGFLYIVMHIIFIIGHYRGPYRHRRDIEKKDVKYRRQILGLDKGIDGTSNDVLNTLNTV